MTKKTDNYQTWVKIITGLYVLVILEKEPAHGNKLASEIKRRTEGTISPNSNALYPLLRIMEELGYINGSWENPDTKGKRIYKITDEGVAYIPILREKFEKRLEQAEQRLEILRKDLL
ncbi:PadR family transcriptional regulator [Dendrosporobacter sp. 1207_IL3150]|uniref:PadR family transcriptional regulator n=1 Tax=Dendrosporobacter sp. 1207_IL3150 TaxID=3084054 RepID=UPI002FDA5D1F